MWPNCMLGEIVQQNNSRVRIALSHTQTFPRPVRTVQKNGIPDKHRKSPNRSCKTILSNASLYGKRILPWKPVLPTTTRVLHFSPEVQTPRVFPAGSRFWFCQALAFRGAKPAEDGATAGLRRTGRSASHFHQCVKCESHLRCRPHLLVLTVRSKPVAVSGRQGAVEHRGATVAVVVGTRLVAQSVGIGTVVNFDVTLD